jgi:hypothetical protein
MGVKGRSGRKPERFCAKGHDKWLPLTNGYLRTDKRSGTVYTLCAVCRRLNIARYQARRKQRSLQGLSLRLIGLEAYENTSQKLLESAYNSR